VALRWQLPESTWTDRHETVTTGRRRRRAVSFIISSLWAGLLGILHIAWGGELGDMAGFLQGCLHCFFERHTETDGSSFLL
jgi:hypothetical protein